MSILSTASRAVSVTPSNTNYLTALQWIPIDGSIQQATAVDLGTETFTKATSGLANGDIIQFNSVGTVTGISINTEYYVINVSGDDFQVSLTYGGSAVALGGATTTLPTFRQVKDIITQRIVGYIYAAGAGNVNLLPADHFDTDTTTEADMGAQIVSFAAGEIKPIVCKKVFSTNTTATGIKVLFNN